MLVSLLVMYFFGVTDIKIYSLVLKELLEYLHLRALLMLKFILDFIVIVLLLLLIHYILFGLLLLEKQNLVGSFNSLLFSELYLTFTLGEVLGEDQRIDVERAFRAYNTDAAYLNFEENLKGSLEVGKLADFIVVSADPFSVPFDEIPEINIEQTYVDGRLVFNKA